MAGLLGVQSALRDRDGVRRGHADALVEHQPAMHVALLGALLARRARLPGRAMFSGLGHVLSVDVGVAGAFPAEVGLRAGPYALGHGKSTGRGSLLVVLRQLIRVLTNFLGAQERIDLGRLIEAVVTAEAQVRRELEVHAMRDLLPERLAVAV